MRRAFGAVIMGLFLCLFVITPSCLNATPPPKSPNAAAPVPCGQGCQPACPGSGEVDLTTALTAVSFENTTPASAYWCGNLSTQKNLNMTDPVPWSDGVCRSRATFNGTPVPARTATEFRGWVRGGAKPGDPINDGGEIDEEQNFDLEVDVGWPALTSSTYAMNSIERLSEIMTWSGDLNGGLVRVHVEMNGWGPCRTCGVARSIFGDDSHIASACADFIKQNEAHGFCSNYHKPPNHWITYDMREPAEHHRTLNLWPFDPANIPHVSSTSTGPLRDGDYVRIVGTSWEDGKHAGDPCWNSASTSDRGWPEIHPVDYLVRLSPPTHDHTSLHNFGICDSGAGNGIETGLNPSPPKHPDNNCLLQSTEKILPDFTNTNSIDPSDASISQRYRMQGDTIIARVAVRNDGGRGVFRSIVKVDWNCSISPTCSSNTERCPDGCVDVNTDSKNCGQCAYQCGVGMRCLQGNCGPIDGSGCTPPCPTGTVCNAASHKCVVNHCSDDCCQSCAACGPTRPGPCGECKACKVGCTCP